MKRIALRLRSTISLRALSLAAIPLIAAACAVGSEPTQGSGDDQADDFVPTQTELEQTVMERFLERMDANPYGALRGAVSKLDGTPIANVTVRVGGETTKTDATGAYSLDRVPLGSWVVSFEHPSYVFTQKRATVELGEHGWLTQELLPRAKSHHIDAEVGGIIQQGPLTLEIEPGDLVLERDQSDVTGDIEVVVTTIDPRVPGELFAAPAELEGVTVDGEQVGLFSYGMLEVEMYHRGEKVNVRAGQTVKSTLDVTEGYETTAGETIPMWHHDTNKGIWVQEAGKDAVVEERNGSRFAVTELPHFSAWNYDGLFYGACAPVVIPSTTGAARVRVMSTDTAGNPDNLWSVSFECAGASGRSSRCAVNVPAAGGVAYFKLQVLPRNSSTWCDLSIALNGSTGTVWNTTSVQTYLARNNLSTAGSWCGNQQPNGPLVSGNYEFSLSQYTLPTNRITFGTAQTSTCPSTVGAMAVTDDSGFQTMAANAASATLLDDYDQDGVADPADTCAGNGTDNQLDANGNGIGDACESICFIPADDPNAAWYDFDGDGIDDYCDTSWETFNPSQL
jgi:Carboxypeptidase regulatory-like domain